MRNIGYESWTAAFAVSCAIDVVLAGAAAAWIARRPSLGRLAVAVVSVGTTLTVKWMVLVAVGLGPFGVIHVLWLDLVVALPLAGLAYLAGGRGRASRWSRAVAGSTLMLVPFGVYASFIEPGQLETERAEVRVPAERAGHTSVRVGVVSDLQFSRVSDHEREAVATLVRERPDVILIAGDFHQGSPAELRAELPRIHRLLRPLRAPGGVIAVQGDAESLPKLRRVIAGTGISALVNERARVHVRDRTISIAGVELRYGSPAARATARRLESAPGRGDIRLLVAHRPDAVFGLERGSRIDLTVAGHTHGGQVQLPLYGPPMIASRVPRKVGAGGLHTLGGRQIYVTRGVGVERGQAPRLRFGAVPEVSILTLSG